MNANRSKMLIGFLSVGGIVSAMVLQGPAACVAAAVCAAAMLVIFWKKAGQLFGVSEDNPKLRTVRGATAFTALYAVGVAAMAIALEKGYLDGYLAGLSPERYDTAGKLLLAALLAVPMAVYGNIAPKLPFSRFMGLRLPWTVRDEQTYIIAHRLLGYMSLPLAVLLFVPVRTGMGLDTYVKFWWTGGLLLWIGVPGVVSGIFYWKKFK